MKSRTGGSTSKIFQGLEPSNSLLNDQMKQFAHIIQWPRLPNSAIGVNLDVTVWNLITF